MRTLLSAGALLVFAISLLAATPFAQAGAGQMVPAFSFAEPGIAPDGSEIAFSSGGDIWSVPAQGGDAHLLVADAATDRRPLYSPDARHLAFVSTRTGRGDIYVLALATGVVRRLTWDDGLEQLDGWSPDSRWVYFSSTSRDIAGMNDIYRVPLAGGTPMVVSGDRYLNEFGAAAAPDGRRLALSARGIASSQWWRRGSSHIDRSELWVRDLETEGLAAYTQLSGRDARQVWPMWGAGGRELFYVSDRGGAENLWVRPAEAAGEDRPVTAFRGGRVLWPSITPDGRTIAFERDFGIWTLDTGTGQASEVPIRRRGAATTPAAERVRRTSQFSDLALSPDGRKVAFTTRGEVFAASAKDGGDAVRVTETAGIESQLTWAPDSRRLVYVSDRDAGQHLYAYDFVDDTETALTSGAAVDLSPVFSPDGERLAFLRDRRELRVLDLETRQDRLLTTGIFADTIGQPRPVWSPDGRWIALFAIGTRGFTNVEMVPLDGGPRRPVSFLSNMFANHIAWSPDGSFLLFDSRQRTEPGSLARVDLTLRTPRFREDLFRDLFDEPTSPPDPPTEDPDRRSPEPGTPEPGPSEPIFKDIRQRLSLLPVGLDVNDVVISPDGKTAVLVASAAGRTNLYAYALDELGTERPVARQLTTTPGSKASPQFTPDSREVYYLDAGRVRVATVESRQSRGLDVTAELTVDVAADRLPVFRQAWALLRDNFFDADMNGIDWNESRHLYEPRAAVAATGDELRRIISLMIGDLNASHLGISPGGGGGTPAIGRLGVTFDRREYENAGRLRVTGVVPLGPAALAQDIAEGDYLVAVNGEPTGAGVNLDELLANTIGRRVELSVAAQPDGSVRDVVVRPANQSTVKSLVYRWWVEKNREYVLKASGGRFGYVHMVNMSAGALDQLHVDLDSENHARDGLVIDLRNNSGGFVNGYALDVFARRSYLRMSTRSLPEAPARAILGQRALELSTILVTNQHSLSDAEDFTEGYRALELGSVVGEPTAGWIIYTWNRPLVDGSSLRLPRMRVRGVDGEDMEGVPRPVDVEATRPLGETGTDRDSQLDAAIRTLLAQLGKAELPGGRP